MIRWTPERKAALLADIDSGRTTEAAAMAEHGISAGELAEWRRPRTGARGRKRKKLPGDQNR